MKGLSGDQSWNSSILCGMMLIKRREFFFIEKNRDTLWWLVFVSLAGSVEARISEDRQLTFG